MFVPVVLCWAFVVRWLRFSFVLAFVACCVLFEVRPMWYCVVWLFLIVRCVVFFVRCLQCVVCCVLRVGCCVTCVVRLLLFDVCCL